MTGLDGPAPTMRVHALEKTSAVKLQTVDDLVDHLALGAHGESDQIELGAHYSLDTARLAASCVVMNMSSV